MFLAGPTRTENNMPLDILHHLGIQNSKFFFKNNTELCIYHRYCKKPKKIRHTLCWSVQLFLNAIRVMKMLLYIFISNFNVIIDNYNSNEKFFKITNHNYLKYLLFIVLSHIIYPFENKTEYSHFWNELQNNQISIFIWKAFGLYILFPFIYSLLDFCLLFLL